MLSERLFTAPRQDCPRPDWWHANDIQSTEIEVSELVGSFIRALQPEYVVETGTYLGQTAQAIGEALHENGHGVLDTIELDYDSAQIALVRCSQSTELPVRINHMSSLDFIPDQPINFAWFDSEIELRIPEFERFRAHLAPGAVCGFHDTGPHKGEFGAKLRALHEVQTIQLPTPRGVTFLQIRGD